MEKEGSLETIEESYTPNQEELERIAENISKYQKLSMWMDANFDNIFEVASENAKYAVGVLEKINGKEVPVIHYFNSKYTKKSIFEPIIKIFRTTNPKGTLDFMVELAEKGNTLTHMIYRHQNEMELMY